MKKEYIKPSIKTIALENCDCILDGSLTGSFKGEKRLEYGGESSDENIKKDGGFIWGD